MMLASMIRLESVGCCFALAGEGGVDTSRGVAGGSGVGAGVGVGFGAGVGVGVGVGPGLGDGEGLRMEIDTVLSSSPPSLLVLPDESLNLELATEISAVPVPFASGVNVVEYDVSLELAQLESVPPETLTSDASKSETASERLKVIDVLSLRLRDSTSEEISIVGRSVSIERLTVLLASPPSTLLFSAASEKVELATQITPSVLLFSVGVKTAL